MPEGAHQAAVVLYGRSVPQPFGDAGQFARALDAPVEVLECSDRAELSALLRMRFAEGRPAAVVMFDETRENGELVPVLNEVGLGSPLTVRAAFVPGRPAPHTWDAFTSDRLDRLVRVDSRDERLAHDFQMLLGRFARLRRLSASIRGRVGRHIFLTGASGFVGAKLIRELLRCTDVRITALVRSKGDVRYDQRLSLGPFDDRLTFVEGEITAPNLGLTDDALERVRESVDEVWHLAAITDFSKDIRDQLMRVNLEGTREVLRFAKGISGLRCFNHVSTAYVAGDRNHPERVMERVESSTDAFKNPYEESKNLAERAVVESGLPHMIFRPSVIFGESYSGRGDGKTVYGVAEVFRVAKLLADRRGAGNGRGVVFRVRARSDATLNLIPVDWVVDEMLRIRAATEPDGTVYHITHDKPVSIDELHDVLIPLCGLKRCIVDPELAPRELDAIERFIYRRLNAFRPYMMERDPVFDRSNVERVLGAEPQPAISGDAIRYALDTFFSEMTKNGSDAPATERPVA